MFVITEDTFKFSIHYIFRFVSAQYHYGIFVVNYSPWTPSNPFIKTSSSAWAVKYISLN